MKKYTLFSLFAIFFMLDVQAQDEVADEDISEMYYEDYRHITSLRLYSAYKFQTFALSNNVGDRVRYLPANQPAVGIGMTRDWFVMDLGVVIPTGSTYDEQYGNTLRIDVVSDLFLEAHVINIGAQVYKGFYQPDFPVDALDEDDVIYGQRSDVRTFAITLNHNYVFNHEKFSFRSAFIGDSRQKVSAGSPLLGVYFAHYNIRADGSMIPDNSSLGFSDEMQLEGLSTINMGINGGYAYTYVFQKYFYISGAFTPGIGAMMGDYRPEGGEWYRNRGFIDFAWKLGAMGAFGYNHPKYYVVVSQTFQQYYNFISDEGRNQFANGRLKVAIGYRLK